MDRGEEKKKDAVVKRRRTKTEGDKVEVDKKKTIVRYRL